MMRRSFLVALLILINSSYAWTTRQVSRGVKSTDLSETVSALSRRQFAMAVASVFSVVVVPGRAQAATSKVEEALEEMRASKEKLQAIPGLLEEKEWDKVRTILKLPPVNKLWNLGDSQNTVLLLAKETGDIDLFELKDELAYNLQICDQLTYDNAFVYFQPGNGKVKIKEPQQLALLAMKQIQQVIDIASSE